MDKDTIEFELEKYLKLDIEYETSNELGPFYFYSKNENFKRLNILARAILSVPATSVPSECLFSHAGLIQTEIRNRLSPVLLESIVLIKDNS